MRGLVVGLGFLSVLIVGYLAATLFWPRDVPDHAKPTPVLTATETIEPPP